MTNEKKIAIQQRRIDELEERIKTLTNINAALEMENKCLKDSFSGFQDELEKAREARRGYENAMAQLRAIKKDYDNKMSILLKRLERQTKK